MDNLELRLPFDETLEEAKKKKADDSTSNPAPKVKTKKKRDVKVVSAPIKGKQCIVRLNNGKYRLVSKNGKNMGTFDSAAEADKARIAQFAYLSARGKGNHNPGKKYGDKHWDKKHGESLQLRIEEDGYKKTSDDSFNESLELKDEAFWGYQKDAGNASYAHNIYKAKEVPVKSSVILQDNNVYKVLSKENIYDIYARKRRGVLLTLERGSEKIKVLADPEGILSVIETEHAEPEDGEQVIY